MKTTSLPLDAFGTASLAHASGSCGWAVELPTGLVPPSMVRALGLTWWGKGAALMANGKVDQCDLYSAQVLWDGQIRGIFAEMVNTDPLVGTSMLKGYELQIEFVAHGNVHILAIRP